MAGRQSGVLVLLGWMEFVEIGGRMPGTGKRLGQGAVMNSGMVAALLLMSLVGCGLGADSMENPEVREELTLMVLVVVDQLGSDFLEQEAGGLEGGLARIMLEGSYYPRADLGYAVTNSAPGHATAVTGALPWRHGIVDNGWMEQGEDGTWQYLSAVSDPNQSVLGVPVSNDGVSPHRRRAPTLGDWALAINPESRAISIGQGATSANTMAAASGGTAFWFSSQVNGFVTSTYYSAVLPDWVLNFNQEILPELQRDSSWTPTGSSRGGGVPTHRYERDPDDAAAYASWYQQVPAMDGAILRLARESVVRLELGGRGAVDVLTLNLSSVDEAGHTYGARSPERADALRQVDGFLGEFMAFLDDTLGPRGWALALTGDHGVAPSPEDTDPAEPRAVAGAERVRLERLRTVFQTLEDSLSRTSQADRAEAARAFLVEQSFVHRVYSVDELANADRRDSGMLADYARSFTPGRLLDWPVYDMRGDLSPASLGIGAVQLTEGSVVDFAVGVHGSPYTYDRFVPLLFWAPGRMPSGPSATGSAALADLAPTLAGLAGIVPSAEVDGRDLGIEGGG